MSNVSKDQCKSYALFFFKWINVGFLPDENSKGVLWFNINVFEGVMFCK
jgi:hypothetical protein